MKDINRLPTEILELRDLLMLDHEVGAEALSFAAMRTHFSKLNVYSKNILGFIDPKNDFAVVSLSSRELTLKRKVIDTGYVAIRPVKVFKPSGFVGSVHTFVTLLEKLAPEIIALDKSILAFETALAKIVNENDLVTKPLVGLPKSSLKDGTDTLKEFGDFFQGKSGIDTAEVGKLYGNMRSLIDTSDLLINLTEQFNGSDVKSLVTRANSLYTTLEYLEEGLEQDGLVMTDKWRHAIGQELYRITEWLGIYSLFITKLVAISVSHKDTVTKLNNL